MEMESGEIALAAVRTSQRPSAWMLAFSTMPCSHSGSFVFNIICLTAMCSW